MAAKTGDWLRASVRGLVLLLAGVLLGLSGVGDAHADEPALWEQAWSGGTVGRLFTPASGPLFAATGCELLRSDDGGGTWRPVPLPPTPSTAASSGCPYFERALAIDPTNHAVLYAQGADGLYKSADDAASWSVVLPTKEVAEAVAVSPADPSLVYAGLTRGSMSSEFRFLRSRDGGASWEQLEAYNYTLCAWSVAFLMPHPTDAQRILRSAGCYAGRDFGGRLQQSTDQGATWTKLWETMPKPGGGTLTAYPRSLAGGQGPNPGRYYLAVELDSRFGLGASILRSDDDAQSWSEVLQFRDPKPSDPALQRSTAIVALASDPGQPDVLFAALNERDSVGHAIGGMVARSRDGGATWSAPEVVAPGGLRDLALGVDGANLYAAGAGGIWRLRLR